VSDAANKVRFSASSDEAPLWGIVGACYRMGRLRVFAQPITTHQRQRIVGCTPQNPFPNNIAPKMKQFGFGRAW
jgi:hypothetical protein